MFYEQIRDSVTDFLSTVKENNLRYAIVHRFARSIQRIYHQQPFDFNWMIFQVWKRHKIGAIILDFRFKKWLRRDFWLVLNFFIITNFVRRQLMSGDTSFQVQTQIKIRGQQLPSSNKTHSRRLLLSNWYELKMCKAIKLILMPQQLSDWTGKKKDLPASILNLLPAAQSVSLIQNTENGQLLQQYSNVEKEWPLQHVMGTGAKEYIFKVPTPSCHKSNWKRQKIKSFSIFDKFCMINQQRLKMAEHMSLSISLGGLFGWNS